MKTSLVRSHRARSDAVRRETPFVKTPRSTQQVELALRAARDESRAPRSVRIRLFAHYEKRRNGKTALNLKNLTTGRLSARQNILTSEMTKNADCFDRDDPDIYGGPVPAFFIAAGNSNFATPPLLIPNQIFVSGCRKYFL